MLKSNLPEITAEMERRLKTGLKNLSIQIPILFQPFLAREMETQFKKSTRRLFRSFLGGNDSLTKMDVSGYSIRGTIGSKLPYAAIQEEGGKVKAKTKQSTARTILGYTKAGKISKKKSFAPTGKRSKWAMEAFMWYKFYDTKDDVYRKIALFVRRHGYVILKPKPYFHPAWEKFRYSFPNLLNKLLRGLSGSN